LKKILFVSDTHLHPMIWDDLPEVWGDAYRAFDQVCLRAVEDAEVTSVFLGGDVFDRHPESCAMECFIRNVVRLKEANKPVYAIQGQHGKVRTRGRTDVVPWSSVHSWVRTLDKTPVLMLPKTYAVGIDNCGHEALKEALPHVSKKASVLFLHQMIKGGVPLIKDVQNWDLDPEWVPEHIKLVLAGDLHIPAEFPIPGGKLIYNGSTCLRSIDEPEEKFYTLVDENLNIERVSIPSSRVFKRASIFNDKSLQQALEAASKMPPLSVLHVKYDPRLEGVEHKLRTANESMYFKFIPSPVLSSVVGEAELALPENVSPAGFLDEFVDRNRNSALHSFLLQLITAPDERVTLESQRKEFLGE
jgi:DNA repair exonuclease SbcCD nuclease subunit